MTLRKASRNHRIFPSCDAAIRLGGAAIQYAKAPELMVSIPVFSHTKISECFSLFFPSVLGLLGLRDRVIGNRA